MMRTPPLDLRPAEAAAAASSATTTEASAPDIAAGRCRFRAAEPLRRPAPLAEDDDKRLPDEVPMRLSRMLVLVTPRALNWGALLRREVVHV